MTAPWLSTPEDHQPLPDGSTWADWAQWVLDHLQVSPTFPLSPRLVLLARSPWPLPGAAARSGWVDPAGQLLAGSLDAGPVEVIDLPSLPTQPGAQLAQLRQLMARKLEAWQGQGVILWDPSRVWVGPLVQAEPGATIGPDVVLLGKTQLAAGAVVEERCSLRSSQIGPGARIKAGSVLEGAQVGPGASVGPMAHLRPGTILEAEAKVGNFVEVKSSRLGPGAKASHLTYLGDASVGAGANIGAGTITCNYDGFAKHRTEIGPGAFIGSNTALVAPVVVGAEAIVGAGSVIVSEVPAGAVALARAEQQTRPGAAARVRERFRARAPKKERS